MLLLLLLLLFFVVVFFVVFGGDGLIITTKRMNTKAKIVTIVTVSIVKGVVMKTEAETLTIVSFHREGTGGVGVGRWGGVVRTEGAN